MKLVNYRVVRMSYSVYECQVFQLWWPFWRLMRSPMIFLKLEDAIKYIEQHKYKAKTHEVVWHD
jgi:hypothetical protein